MFRRSFLGLPLLVATARAHSLQVRSIKVGHAWALPASMGEDGQCFMPMLNSGELSETLVGAHSAACSAIELRASPDDSAPPETGFSLAPNAPLAMRPKARHLRLVGLKRPLLLGEKFTLTLSFRVAGLIDVEVFVERTPGQ